MKKITNEELENIRQFMIREFYASIELDRWRKSGDDYWWKWFFTKTIADGFKMKSSAMRRRLDMLEKSNMVHSKREPNNILWCVNDIPGYRQYKWNDYYQRVPLKELRKKKLDAINEKEN